MYRGEREREVRRGGGRERERVWREREGEMKGCERKRAREIDRERDGKGESDGG
jgi:hypothetical protein